MAIDTEFSAPIHQWYGTAFARRDGALGVFTPDAYTAYVWAEDHDSAISAFIRQAHADGWEPMYCCVSPTDR